MRPQRGRCATTARCARRKRQAARRPSLRNLRVAQEVFTRCFPPATSERVRRAHGARHHRRRRRAAPRLTLDVDSLVIEFCSTLQCGRAQGTSHRNQAVGARLDSPRERFGARIAALVREAPAPVVRRWPRHERAPPCSVVPQAPSSAFRAAFVAALAVACCAVGVAALRLVRRCGSCPARSCDADALAHHLLRRRSPPPPSLGPEAPGIA